MQIMTFTVAELLDELPGFAPVPVSVGEPVSQVRSLSRSTGGATGVRAGVWECTPGRWIRQIEQAEFCHFLEGEAIFRPESGADPVHLKAGDAAFFPARSQGEWEVISTSRKIFFLHEGTSE